MSDQSSDAIRGEFAAAVPQQATNARSLPVPQILFVATVLRLESLRAEAGQPASMLSYFHVENINNHQQVYETLSSVADKVSAGLCWCERLTPENSSLGLRLG